MAAHYQLNFIQDKIAQIQSAICFNLSDSVLKLPTSVITTLKVDDYGFVWFMMQKPKQCLKEFEDEFPVRLDYFKKGINSFLQVSGKGCVVCDPEELNTLGLSDDAFKSFNAQKDVLVKVKILKAECYDTTPTSSHSWFKNRLTAITKWLHHNNYGRQIYYPAS